ncbi:MAG TPA: carboxypeptidase-like regulatory domain-containing protein [Gemmatimonadales bacterium]|nr:carboxypeptidase-like regulatory domain-containing protein [Gemmatimonadales bacterium]
MPRPQVVRGRAMPEEVTVRSEPAAEPERDQLPVATAPEPPAAAPEPRPVQPPVDIAAARAAEMRAEAQRLFGPRRLGSDRPPGPVSASWVNQLTDDRENDCTPRPRPPRDPSVPPELGTVSGRVFRAGTTQPLPGAYLQILGTPYATFADDEGDYTLEFDRSLVDDCRTQYVQVSKDGFAPQRLILSLGSRTSNDIPLRRR